MGNEGYVRVLLAAEKQLRPRSLEYSNNSKDGMHNTKES